MTLREWLRDQELSQRRFAEMVNEALRRLDYPPDVRVWQQQIDRYCKGAIPSIPIMRAIFVATRGLVEPNSWYDLPDLAELAA